MKFWTEERVTELRLKWSQGFTASQIAADMHAESRSAIIGKVHRLGLPGREKPQANPDKKLARRERYERLEKRRPRPRIRAIETWLATQPPYQRLTSDLPTQSTGVSILELKGSSCRWPLWGPEAREGLYCGMRVVDGHPWCGVHCRMAYVAPSAGPKRPFIVHLKGRAA